MKDIIGQVWYETLVPILICFFGVFWLAILPITALLFLFGVIHKS